MVWKLWRQGSAPEENFHLDFFTFAISQNVLRCDPVKSCAPNYSVDVREIRFSP